MKLENKVAIITGGSRGIGYATVENLSKRVPRFALQPAVRPLPKRPSAN